MTIRHEKTLRAISVVLSPTGIAIMVSGVFSFGSPIGVGTLGPIWVFILGTIFIGFLPISAVILERSKGNVSLEVPDQEERTRFLVLAVFFYGIGAVIFYLIQCLIMFVISMAYVAVTSTVTAVNSRTKVSIHAAGAAGPLTAIVIVYGMWTVFVYSIVLLVVLVRLKLKAHTPNELMMGTVIGIIVTGLTLLLLLPLWS